MFDSFNSYSFSLGLIAGCLFTVILMWLVKKIFFPLVPLYQDHKKELLGYDQQQITMLIKDLKMEIEQLKQHKQAHLNDLSLTIKNLNLKKNNEADNIDTKTAQNQKETLIYDKQIQKDEPK